MPSPATNTRMVTREVRLMSLLSASLVESCECPRSLLVNKDHHPFPRAVPLPLQHIQSVSAPTGRRGLWGQLILAFTFEPLARQAVLDLNVFVFGRVAQHLEARVLGAE